MSIFLEQHFDQGNGTTVSTTNSGSSGSAFGSVTATGLTLTYSTEQHAHGTASMKVTTPATGGSSGNVIFQKLGTPLNYAWRLYVYLGSLPSSATAVVAGYYGGVAGTQGTSNLVLYSDGKVGLQRPNSDGTQTIYQIPLATFTMTTGHWYRFEGTATGGTTGGGMTLAVYDADGTTALGTIASSVGWMNGTTGLTQLQVGKGTTTPTMSSFYIDDLAFQDSASLIGPFVAAPSGTLTGSQGPYAYLDASGIVSGSDVMNYAISPTTGTVQPGGVTSPYFIAPVPAAGTSSQTYTVTATDTSTAKSTTSTFVVTAPAAVATATVGTKIRVRGAWV